MSLLFRVADLRSELINLEKLAKRRLRRDQQSRLTQLADQLERFRHGGGRPEIDWGWPEDEPLVLEPSVGAYQPNAGGAETIEATIDSTWRLRRVDAQVVAVVGNASVRIQFNHGRLGMWRMELGAADAPGCFFHVQIRGQDETAPWPRTVDVPRLPGIVATPASAVEFVLGELHQDEWPSDVRRDRAAAALWKGTQCRRWTAFLSWQQAAVDNAYASPWVEIKSAQPDAELFL